MKSLYEVVLFNGPTKVYQENLPFTLREPNKEDINGFIKLIQPNLKYTDEETRWFYVRELKDTEL